MYSIFLTDKGRVRTNNEDCGGVFLNKSRQRLAIVADGMGGHKAGDVASNMAVSMLQERWEKEEEIKTAEGAEEWLRENISAVNRAIYEYAKEHDECQGMGTTIEAVILTKIFATIAHVGDSRSYIFNANGFQQLTEDHTFVNELVRSGQITEEDAEHHPRKNVILRALGTEENIKIDLKTITFEEDDLLLICSDGLSNKVDKDEIVAILEKEDSLEEMGRKLLKTANDNGGEDNITLILLKIEDEEWKG